MAHDKGMFCTIFLNLVTWERSVQEKWNRSTEGTKILSSMKLIYRGVLDFRFMNGPRQSCFWVSVSLTVNENFPQRAYECKWIKFRFNVRRKAEHTDARVHSLSEGKGTCIVSSLKYSKTATLCQPPKQQDFSKINSYHLQAFNHVWSSKLNLHTLSHLIPTTILWGGYSYCPHTEENKT